MKKKVLAFIISGLLLLALSTLFFTRSMPGLIFESITFSQWFERVPFEPVVLYPVPESMELMMGPTHSTSRDYVDIFYFTEWGIEPPRAFNLAQSHIPIEESDVYVKRYRADRDDVTIERRTALIDGQDVKVEIRISDNPLAGVETEEVLLYFQLKNTYVICFCQNMTGDEALEVFEQHAKLVTKDDIALIHKLDHYLFERDERARAISTAEAQTKAGGN